MRPHEIFASMSPERAEAVFEVLAGESPAMFDQLVVAAAAALKSRPQFLRKQPFARRAAAVRRTLSRFSSAGAAEEMLAVYFLECRKEILVEWLDLLGLKHEEGILKEDAPAMPDAETLTKHVTTFYDASTDPAGKADRLLLLQAFGAQTSIDWPKLDELVAERAG